MIKETIKISGMSCSHCVKSVENAISDLPVNQYEVEIGKLIVEYNPDEISREQILTAIREAGYEPYEE
jgi:copper chaperone CopZ